MFGRAARGEVRRRKTNRLFMPTHWFTTLVFGLLSMTASAQGPALKVPASTIDKADTVWVIVASVLVLLMTPALALFYGGMVRRKNVLSTMVHSFIIMGIVSLVWVLLTYSIAFGKCTNGFVGGFEYLFGNGISMKLAYPYTSPVGTVPAGAFMLFQMMFAIITPALISGAVAERMKFSAYVVFTTLWAILVYAPIACWVWNPGGWLAQRGALDFAGGTVVHLASGASALAACIVLGRRRALTHNEPVLPNNVTTTLLGAGLLWVGWIGFNAGSALAMNDIAISAFVATHLAAAAGMLGWLVCERLHFGKPTALGAASGLVAGLVGITPAAGFVSPQGAILIGFLVGAICCFAVGLKNKLKYDDSLDVVGVHGIGGATGAILTGILATVAVNSAVGDSLKSNGGRMGLVLTQLIGVTSVGVFAFAGSYMLMKLIQATMGVRVIESEEEAGLDISLHGEAGYNL
jgi:Amt family ammonium transporter